MCESRHSAGVDYTPVHSRAHPLKPKARSRFLARLLFGADVFLQHAGGFVPRLLPDLEFRHPVVECRGRETGAKRVGAIAVEVADPGAPQCPLQYPRHRSRVQGGFLHVFPAVDLAEDRPALDAGLAQPLVERPNRAGTFSQRRTLGLTAPDDQSIGTAPEWNVDRTSGPWSMVTSDETISRIVEKCERSHARENIAP